jgi:hypothetical protein
VEYKPNQMEGMFQLDQSAQDIRRLLLDQAVRKEASEKMKVQVGDIQEIVAVTDQGEYALLKIKKDLRDPKYSSHSYVAVNLKTP